MSANLAGKYDRRVPRYTSYPTAPHFTEAVGAKRHRGWLSELPGDARLSLYVHVPFCPAMCSFCGCSTRVVNRYAPVRAYVETLIDEIDLVAQALDAPRPVSAVHFGGGSPTMLTGEDLVRLVERLRRRFAVAEDAEISVEVDPRHTSADFTSAMAAAGVARASLGVQDFDPEVQRAVNRVQPFEVVREAVDRLREAGIVRLNLDLLYGLPRQTPDGLTRTARLALALDPNRVALFGYAHVPWMRKHQRLIDEDALPGPSERLEQFKAASAVLERGGFVAIGLDHFAAPSDGLARAAAAGRLRRNFQGYTDDDADVLIGLGASAISALPQGYVQNAADVRGWRGAVEQGRLATVRGLALEAEDRFRGEIIERLMCDLKVDVARVSQRHGQPADRLAAEIAALELMARDGLVSVEGGEVRVSAAGRPFVRLACAAFDAYLEASETRHARAV